MDKIKDILRGVVIGVANIIPGVSGGTMMVSMGVYDTLIGCINHLFSDFKGSISKLWPYVVGMALGIVGLAKVITMMLDKIPVQTAFLFIGLILGSLPIILNRIKGQKTGAPAMVAGLLAFLLVVGLQVFGRQGGTDVTLTLNLGQIIILFLIGIIASATMVIPGVSGSMMLMLLGYYNPIVGTVSRLIDVLIHFDLGGILSCVGILAPFGIGVVCGIFGVAKLIEILLNRFPGVTFSAILGLVLASPVAILIEISFAGATVVTFLTAACMLAAGFVCAMKLGGE